MKKRLNVLCVLILLVLGYSVYETAYAMWIGMKAGIEAATESRDDMSQLEALKHLKMVAVLPDNLIRLTDSLYNDKTGEVVPALYTRLIISYKTESTLWQAIVGSISVYVRLFVMIFALVLFYKLIMSINRSNVFNWRNVRRLRKIGVLMIIGFFCSAVPIWITSYQLSDVFSLKGYTLILSDLISTTNLVLGIVALIVAEVFAIGLKLQEEQELTI